MIASNGYQIRGSSLKNETLACNRMTHVMNSHGMFRRHAKSSTQRLLAYAVSPFQSSPAQPSPDNSRGSGIHPYIVNVNPANTMTLIDRRAPKPPVAKG